MFFRVLTPSMAGWLLMTACVWPEDRGRALLATAAGAAAGMTFVIDALSPRARIAVAVIAVALAAINLLLPGVPSANLTVSAALLFPCGMTPASAKGDAGSSAKSSPAVAPAMSPASASMVPDTVRRPPAAA